MDLNALNYILEAIGLEYKAVEKLNATGQRQAYLSNDSKGVCCSVIKICPAYPNVVARIQREVNILCSIDSEYFPKVYYNSFITNENLEDIYDNINPKENPKLLADLKKANIQPFFISVEEYINNIKWDVYLVELKTETALVSFLIHLFSAINLLWNAKIVHRDLKPENILIRPNGKPVVIDLGIAKSFKEGTMDLTGVFFHTPCTPRFAAPEQLFNNKTEITYKTDQFSIGIIAICILTNKFAYGDVETDGIEQVLENIAGNNICDLSTYNISDRLLGLVLKFIQVEPYKRFRNPDNILDELYKIREELTC